MHQLTHKPFSLEAHAYGKTGREFNKYSNCMTRWTLFFANIAQAKQVRYEEERKAFLLEEAKNTRSVHKSKKKNLTIKSVYDERKKALEDLVKAGLSPEKREFFKAFIG